MVFNGRMFFLLRTIFRGNKSKYDFDCPRNLVESINEGTVALKNIYNKLKYDDITHFELKNKIFSAMTLMAKNIDNYYDIALECIQKYIDGLSDDENKVDLPDEIGYALGNCESDKEKKLKNILFTSLEENKEKIVCILSKAIWGNENFIFNFEKDKLFYYLDVAINYIVKIFDIENKNEYNYLYLGRCIEYILGIFRLRELGDSELNYKLSLNNSKIQLLYEYIEKIIDKVKNNELEIVSFLKLEITDKGQYKDIPDLLYAMLVYITGDTGSSNIKINIDENEENYDQS